MDQSEVIDRYLRGQMTEKEEKEFEALLQRDQQLADKVIEEREIVFGIRDHFDSLLKRQLQDSDNQKKKPEAKRRFLSRVALRWSAAACIAIIIIGALVILNSGPDHQQLFAEYHTDYPNIVSPQQRGDSSPGSAAFEEYGSQQWLAAYTSFTNLIQDTPNEVYPRFYRAQCALNLGRSDQAITDLRWVIDQGPSEFMEASSWYLALAYVQARNDKEAIQLLESISVGESVYSGEAQSLLLEIE